MGSVILVGERATQCFKSYLVEGSPEKKNLSLPSPWVVFLGYPVYEKIWEGKGREGRGRGRECFKSYLVYILFELFFADKNWKIESGLIDALFERGHLF